MYWDHARGSRGDESIHLSYGSTYFQIFWLNSCRADWGLMKRTAMGLIQILTLALANAAQLSLASTEELLALNQQLRSIQGGSQAASVENVLFKRDAAIFTGTHAGEKVSTEDFPKTLEKHAGRPMDWFFNEWAYGAETPPYEFSYHFSNADGGQTELSLSLTQSVSRNHSRPIFRRLVSHK